MILLTQFAPLLTDYIAKVIVNAINSPANDPDKMIIGAGKVRFDLHDDGSYRSDKKTFTVQDRNGYFYEVTISSLIGQDK
jgi:hypothetical protein